MLEAIRQHLDPTRLRFVGFGLLVGVLTGGVVATFRWAIEHILQLMQQLYRQPTSGKLLLIGLASILLGVIVARLLKSEPNIAGSGIPQVEGQLAGEMDFNWWSILWKKFVAGVLSIGPGLFLGREGPSIQLGAAVGQGVAHGFKRSGSDRRIMIAAGAAGGLAAAFNAPIAGTMFVLEEVYHNFSPLVWLTSLASAVGANFISLNVFGEVPVLHLVYDRPLPLALYWHLLLLGVVLGLLGFLYQQVLLAMPKLYRFTKIPRAYQGLVPFLLVIPIGVVAPNILGGGNGLITGFNHAIPALGILVAIFAVRFIFSMVSYGSGLPGGIFLPILSLGAVIGAVYAVFMANVGLLPQEYVMNLIIFAMAGYFAGIGKAPFTAILLITEMVGNLTNLMAMAVLSLVAYLVVDLLGGAPIYESLLRRMTVPKQIESIHRMDRLELPIYEGGVLEGMQVRDFAWPKQTLLMSIRRGENTIIPHGDTVIHAGDTLVLLTDSQKRAQVRQQIEKLAAKLSTQEEKSGQE
ncbi:MAG: ClC family H(+)/Cl(-) exchange transporter [Lactobacillus sp.]|uniref:Chloride channel protein n=1 Tax=Lacticaseibacillus suilingensis TaxID=2799577 RepID=A0ABW4BHP9_9LACO|nr:ClC family H(+)/Cl(-) exchange transporter [Lacticaseibacillus suilingensis]MCI1894101.1 ClC family H(+)/Cl(-) exchange transporter [Lactobacillus sp.]MCI1941417.1 ClC family H(+)/Cl(-) exchange transporter [Lactobacillus sp.]MCI1972072.1 ClC family H(+)/Cl(-) exchange transporter [Lactobacillus sp.]MCI2016085.1 ClC family H(+)/Cl(-) exchange transporter [Lactobacillus sp.]MCI2036482.1 ClC family H(+)/Cl(-) exchange transporter [Lactobacillus sp.]